MPPERIDLSALDPSRDAGRWEALLKDLSARAVAELQSPVLCQLTAWARPALAVAALAAFACWLPAFADGGTASGGTRLASVDAARTLSEWETGRQPSAAQAALSAGGESLEE
jgi:hypothetical protein